jgi:hypothetical protein
MSKQDVGMLLLRQEVARHGRVTPNTWGLRVQYALSEQQFSSAVRLGLDAFQHSQRRPEWQRKRDNTNF